MTDEEAIEFERLKTARDALLLTVADLRGQLETIAAIKEALAQPEPCDMGDICIGCSPRNADGSCPSSQPEQEPVAWRTPKLSNLDRKYGYRDFDDPVCGIDGKPSSKNEPLYTRPPKRTWVGLTGKEAMDVTRKEGHELLDYICEYGTGVEGVEERIVAICKAIEVRLKQNNGYSEEKNNANN